MNIFLLTSSGEKYLPKRKTGLNVENFTGTFRKMESSSSVFFSLVRGKDFWKDFLWDKQSSWCKWNQCWQHLCKSSSTRPEWFKKGSCVGISKGGKTTKIHITTDKKGRPIIINLSTGNINDCLLFEKQISGIHLEKVAILADSAYSTYEIIESLTIPPKSNMKNLWDYDKNLYKFRNKVERFFQTLKNNRRIATRYEKLDDNFLGFVYFHSILFWLK